MRESIGMVSLLNFIIFFIFLVFAFLMGTFSYYKAYRVNNSIVSSIEKYEGFNDLAISEIDIKLGNLGYERVNFNCPLKKGDGVLLNSEGVEADSSSNRGYMGYCVYVYEDDSVEKLKTDVYESYEVTTIISFQFPIVQNILKLRVNARTDRIYDFEAVSEAMKKTV